MPMPVKLEPRSVSHAEELFDVLADPRLYEYIDEDPPASVEALRAKLQRSESRKSPDQSEDWLNWIVRDESGRLAGYVQTTVFANREANVAYTIGVPWWGLGIAFAAVRQMLDLVQTDFRPPRFIITAERANSRSLMLALRLGFRVASVSEASSRKVAAGDLLLLKEAT
jgi:[ribosomal protein S5]-alanine N-acetyltransferase